MRSFLVCLILILGAQAKADAETWGEVIQMISDTAQMSNAGFEMYMDRTTTAGDKDKNHINYGLIIRAFFKVDGGVSASTDHVVDHYTKHPKGWLVDQWIFSVDKMGELIRNKEVIHRQIVKTNDSTVLETYTIEPTEDQAYQKWNQVYKHWVNVLESYKKQK